jgi:Icc-related predicted phosphoesterase
MRVQVVSDVHGATADLARAADGADVFICLGDLLLYLDYDDPTVGAFADVFGPEVTARYIRLRTAKRFDEARQLSADAWHARPEATDPHARMSAFAATVQRQYDEIFNAMPTPALLTFGNVDLPSMWPTFLRSGQSLLDGQVVDIQGLRFGFVGGGLPSPYRTPTEIPVPEFDAKIAALGPVDVLCTHIPPQIAELTFDVVARRFEVGSAALLEAIGDLQPRYSLFGHVHQPLASRMRIGRTECINVGHFRSTRVPFVLDIPN